MNQKAWDALVACDSRKAKQFSPEKITRRLRQNVESVFLRMPAEDLATLENHWRTKQTAVHPLKGTIHPAPLFLLGTNFGARNTGDRASGMAGSEGCSFVFEWRLVSTAPGEVIQSVIAHELAHGLIHAKYHANNLPLPQVNAGQNTSGRTCDEYPIDEVPEEMLVDETVTRWGYNQILLEFWEQALEDAPGDPSAHYAMLKRLHQ